MYKVIFIGFLTLSFNSADEETNTPKFDLSGTINTIKDKVKDVAGEVGINKVEDIPEVADWVEKCKETVGRREWRVIRTSPKRMIDCISKYVKPDKIKLEVEDSKKRGELDLVFKKYCGRREEVMECVDEVLERVKPCLDDQQLKDLNTTREAADAAIDFICYENGDRIALFLAEEGIGCVKNNTEQIKSCVKKEVPEVETIENEPKSLKIDQFLINDENCLKLGAVHRCIVSATESCDDPTPSNILDSLITWALKVTPCSQSTRAISSSTVFYGHFSKFFPHFLTIVMAGLTAAQILL